MNMEKTNEGLKELGHKTEYKMDYAPEVSGDFREQASRGTIIGSASTAQNSRLYAL
jgi:hypothetical protein